MNSHALKDIRLGVFLGIAAFFLLVLPMLRIYSQGRTDNKKSLDPPVIYIKEIR